MRIHPRSSALLLSSLFGVAAAAAAMAAANPADFIGTWRAGADPAMTLQVKPEASGLTIVLPEAVQPPESAQFHLDAMPNGGYSSSQDADYVVTMTMQSAGHVQVTVKGGNPQHGLKKVNLDLLLTRASP